MVSNSLVLRSGCVDDDGDDGVEERGEPVIVEREGCFPTSVGDWYHSPWWQLPESCHQE